MWNDVVAGHPGWIAVGVAVVVVIGVATAAGVGFLERQRQRDARATVLQERLLQAFDREPALAAAGIFPTVQVPRRGPVSVVLDGHVPSRQAHDTARRVVDEVLARATPGFHVDDHLRVDPLALRSA